MGMNEQVLRLTREEILGHVKAGRNLFRMQNGSSVETVWIGWGSPSFRGLRPYEGLIWSHYCNGLGGAWGGAEALRRAWDVLSVA